MANIVWAKASGNWITTTLWAFWNESTQQVEDYGQIPQADDVVYLNTYTISVNLVNTSLIDAAEIHNDINPYTNQSGGFIDLLNSTTNELTLTINADIIGNGATSTQMIIRCGIDANTDRRLMNMIINGVITNAYIRNDHRVQNISVVNGNVTDTLWYSRHGSTGATRNLTINGNVSNFRLDNSNNGATNLTINGRVTDIGSSLITGSAGKTCNINGYIKFSSNNEFIHSIHVNGIADMSDIATIDDIFYPFSVGYGILRGTDTTIKTTKLVDYPTPANVKKDIPYAFNQMAGTYDINQYLPPETVVLKDYVYDGGEMVGTYEGGGTVQNTINVYPYKKRNN